MNRNLNLQGMQNFLYMFFNFASSLYKFVQNQIYYTNLYVQFSNLISVQICTIFKVPVYKLEGTYKPICNIVAELALLIYHFGL